MKRFYMWMTRQLVCRQAVALMSDYIDGHLTPADARRLERHLARCPHCAEYLAQLQLTIDALGRATPDAVGDDALDEFVTLYRSWRADPS
jgi:anti-sigma factor RsiW